MENHLKENTVAKEHNITTQALYNRLWKIKFLRLLRLIAHSNTGFVKAKLKAS